MTHRIREAMCTGALAVIGGAGEAVEVDETYIGGKEGIPFRGGFAHERAVVSLVDRGNKARLFHADKVTKASVQLLVKANTACESRLLTDGSGIYSKMSKAFAEHLSVVR